MKANGYDLQTLSPDACAYCAGCDWAVQPTECTCPPVVRVRARIYQHIHTEAHVVLTHRQMKRLVPGVTYRWGRYHARVIPEIAQRSRSARRSAL